MAWERGQTRHTCIDNEMTAITDGKKVEYNTSFNVTPIVYSNMTDNDRGWLKWKIADYKEFMNMKSPLHTTYIVLIHCNFQQQR